MKKKYLILVFICFTFVSFQFINNQSINDEKYKDGDIILQTSESEQCEAVRIATNSKFSHCGIIYIENGQTYVFEAVQPVKMTLLSEWIKQGKDNKFVVKRLKNADKVLTKSVVEKIKS